MLNVTMYPAPGLTSATLDLPLAVADLGTSRYRRWVERRRHVAALVRRSRPAPATAIHGREPARIGIASPASGTLSRLS